MARTEMSGEWKAKRRKENIIDAVICTIIAAVLFSLMWFVWLPRAAERRAQGKARATELIEEYNATHPREETTVDSEDEYDDEYIRDRILDEAYEGYAPGGW